jgi:hypothetical protein
MISFLVFLFVFNLSRKCLLLGKQFFKFGHHVTSVLGNNAFQNSILSSRANFVAINIAEENLEHASLCRSAPLPTQPSNNKNRAFRAEILT